MSVSPLVSRSQTLYQPLTATRGRKGSGNIQYNDLFSSTPKRVLQLSHSNACGSQWRHNHVQVAGLLFMLVRLLLARSAYKSPTKNNFQFNEVEQRSHPPRCDVDVTQYTASLLECDNWAPFLRCWTSRCIVCSQTLSFPAGVAVTVGKGSGYARLCLLYQWWVIWPSQ